MMELRCDNFIEDFLKFWTVCECYCFDLFYLKLHLEKLSPNLWTKNMDFHYILLGGLNLSEKHFLLEDHSNIMYSTWLGFRLNDYGIMLFLGVKR